MTVSSDILLAIDTATSESLAAFDDARAGRQTVERWAAGELRGELLLTSVVRVVEQAGASLGDVQAVVVGTGPGSFTGMRVGMAAAKGLAYGLDIPIVGVSTAEALARAAWSSDSPSGSVEVLQPAGPSARYRTIVRRADGRWAVEDGPTLEGLEALVEPSAASAAAERMLVAVDLAAPEAALENGRRAQAGLADALVAAGREGLAQRGPDDLAELVPAYVTLPRGVSVGAGGIAWSRARR